jgi:hypothetical protein
MDLSAWLLRHTPPQPLIITTPGGTAARLAVERAVRARRWKPAMSPAEANILVVAGSPGPVLEPYVRQVWHLFPAPRTRADIDDPADAERLLDSAAHGLRDAATQREKAAHGMDMPGDVPMADRAPDRDGLTLDQLHVPLGPLLPLWPAGLVVRTQLQGDVIQHATVELLDAGRGSFWSRANGSASAAHRLDACARLLAVAGWTDAAVLAQRLRDEALDGVPSAVLLPSVRTWARRIRRSRTVRWLLSGIGDTTDAPASLAGDALSRLTRWLDSAERALAQPSVSPALPDERDTQWTVDALPTLLHGVDLATARLIVASLDPDPDVVTHTGAHHG